jgi:hypothetical protein
MRDHIRIESPDLIATNVKVIYVPSEGEEVDISHCVNAITFEPFEVGAAVRASLRVFVASATVNALVEDIECLKPKKRRPWRRLRDATRFGAQAREAVWS